MAVADNGHILAMRSGGHAGGAGKGVVDFSVKALGLPPKFYWGAARVCAWAALSLGVFLGLGWLASIRDMVSFGDSLVTAKVSTTLSFVFAGVIALVLSRPPQSRTKNQWAALEYALAFLAVTVADMTGGASVSEFLMPETWDPIRSVGPNVPSSMTAFAFGLIGCAAFVSCLDRENSVAGKAGVGLALVVIGAIAVAGYVIESPALYYYVPGKSTAMAVPTAVGFIVHGVVLVLSSLGTHLDGGLGGQASG